MNNQGGYPNQVSAFCDFVKKRLNVRKKYRNYFNFKAISGVKIEKNEGYKGSFEINCLPNSNKYVYLPSIKIDPRNYILKVTQN